MVIIPNYQIGTQVLQAPPIYTPIIVPYYPNNYAMIYPLQNQFHCSSINQFQTVPNTMVTCQSQPQDEFPSYKSNNYQIDAHQQLKQEYPIQNHCQNKEIFDESNIKQEQQQQIINLPAQKIENDTFDTSEYLNNQQKQQFTNKKQDYYSIIKNQNDCKSTDLRIQGSKKHAQVKEYKIKIKNEEEDKNQMENNERIQSQKIIDYTLDEELDIQDEKLEIFMEKITREDQKIILEIQNINTQNCFRNLLKQLQKFINTSLKYIYEYENQNEEKLNGKNLSNYNVVRIENPSQNSRKMFYQKFNKFINSKKFNNLAIKQLVKNKLYRLTLNDFLLNESEDWLSRLNSIYKEDMKKFVQFLILCLKNSKFLQFLHKPIYQFYKTNFQEKEISQDFIPNNNKISQ